MSTVSFHECSRSHNLTHPWYQKRFTRMEARKEGRVCQMISHNILKNYHETFNLFAIICQEFCPNIKQNKPFAPSGFQPQREQESARAHASMSKTASSFLARMRQLNPLSCDSWGPPPETPRAPRCDRDRLERLTVTSVLLSCYGSRTASCRGFIAPVPF